MRMMRATNHTLSDFWRTRTDSIFVGMSIFSMSFRGSGESDCVSDRCAVVLQNAGEVGEPIFVELPVGQYLTDVNPLPTTIKFFLCNIEL